MPASPVSVKLSSYDGRTNWEVYKTPFSIFSEANRWTDGAKACQLAASLRGVATEVLQTLHDTEQLNLNSLFSALDLRFVQKYSKNYARLQMKTRLQKTGVSLRSRKARQLGFLRPPSNCALTNLVAIFRGWIEGWGNPEGSEGKGDVSSRRPCPENSKYCSRVEKKFGVKDQVVCPVTTPSTSESDPRSDDRVRKDQLADPEIKPIIEFKESSVEKPSWQDIAPFHPTTKRY
ncbi:gag-pol [Trichonephila clavipes]|nr:gag-pol [Trichonephila clavipes]